MKALLSVMLGVISSVLLSAGLHRAAQFCDPQSRNTTYVTVASTAPDCEEPCNLL